MNARALALALALAHVTAHIFRQLNAEGASFNTDIILLSYSLSATFPDADLSAFRGVYAVVQWRGPSSMAQAVAFYETAFHLRKSFLSRDLIDSPG